MHSFETYTIIQSWRQIKINTVMTSISKHHLISRVVRFWFAAFDQVRHGVFVIHCLKPITEIVKSLASLCSRAYKYYSKPDRKLHSTKIDCILSKFDTCKRNFTILAILCS